MTGTATEPELAGADPEVAPPGADRAPAWFELSVVGALVLMALVGTIGLALAILGVYRTWATLVLAIPLAVAAVLLLARRLDAAPSGPHAVRGALVALLLCSAFTAFAASVPSQNVVVTRDPGSYANTALWLTQDGSLQVDPTEQTFGGVDGLRFSGAAVYKGDDDTLEFQFNHLASVVMAVGQDVGGYRLMYRMPALAAGLGLLAIYAVAVRASRRPYVSVLAPTLLAVGMPMLYIARNTYSEPFAMALLWGAVLVLASLHPRPSRVVGGLGGLMVGALLATRVDSLAYVAALMPLAAVSVAAAPTGTLRRGRARSWACALGVAAAVGVVGWIDLVERSSVYARNLSSQLGLLRMLTVASLLLSVLGALTWIRRERPPAWAVVHRARIATAAGASVVVVLLLGWWVRPHVQTVMGSLPIDAVASAQTRDGLTVEPRRVYHEDTLRWMAWYLGPPALLAAIGGLGWSTTRFLRGRATAWQAAAVALGLCGGVLYWWRPRITPDQLWATRRFIPAVFPSLAVMVVVTVGAALGMLATRVGPRHARWRQLAAAVAVPVLVVPPLMTTWPLRWQRDQYGYQQVIAETCDMIGPGNAAVVVGNYATITLPQTLRSWCGVPVAAQGDAFTGASPPEAARRVAAELADDGWGTVLVAASAQELEAYRVEGGPSPVSTSEAVDEWAHEPTVDRAPHRYRRQDQPWNLPSPFSLSTLPVEP